MMQKTKEGIAKLVKLVKKQSRGRQITLLVVICYTVLKLWRSRLVKFLRQVVRSHRMLRRLPTPSSKVLPEHPLFGQMCGPVFTRKEELGSTMLSYKTVESLSTNLVTGLQKAMYSEEMQKEGVMVIWGTNSWINSIVPNTMCILTFSDIELVRCVLSGKNLDNFEKGVSYEISKPLVGESILSTSGEKWRHHRKIVNKAFKHELLSGSMPVVLDSAQELCSKWGRWAKEGVVVNIHEEMLKLTIDILGRVAFSSNFGSVVAPTTADAPLYDAFNFVLTTLNKRCMVPLFHAIREWPMKENKKFKKCMERIDNHVEYLIRQRIHQKTDGNANEQTCDLLDMLLVGTKLRMDENGTIIVDEVNKSTEDFLSFQEIVDDIKTMLFAGHDTTGAALSWLVYLLSTHIDIRDRLRTEIFEKFGENGDPTYDELEEMPLLNACVKETLRLYPSAGYTRKAKEDMEIGSYKIPKGVEILFLPYLLQRNPKYYKNPDKFDPDRWLKQDTANVRKGSSSRAESLQTDIGIESLRSVLYPFSLGQRNCVGRPLALMEIRVVIIKLLQKFNFSVPENPQHSDSPVIAMTLNPKLIKLAPELRV